MHRFSVRTRLLIATVLPSLALMLTYLVGVPVWSYYIEDRIFTNIVAAQLQSAEESVRLGNELNVPLQDAVVYKGIESVPSSLRSQIADMQPGIHELVRAQIEGVGLDAFIGVGSHPDPVNRIFVIFDVGSLEAVRKRPTALLVLLAIAGVSAGLLIAGLAVSRSLLMSVRALSGLTRSTNHRDLPPLPDDELGALARDWLKAREQLESAADQQRRFARNASHELRTPVAIASGALELLDRHDELTDARSRELISRVSGSIDQMKQLIEVFLGVSQGELSLGNQQSTVKDVIQSVVSAMEQSGQLHRERVHLNFDQSRQAPVSSTALTVVLRHLLSNAVQHSPEDTPIALVASESKVVICNLIDSDPAPRIAPVSGIGLQVLGELVETIGWRIKVQHSKEQFTCTLELSESSGRANRANG